MERVTIYEPDNTLKKGIPATFGDIFREFIRNRWLTFQLFKRDFFAGYKQSFVGFFWAFIMPFLSVGTFIVLNRSGVFSIGDVNIPYPIYAILGMAIWQVFSSGVVAGANTLVKAGSMIVKINFSRKSLVLASIAQSLVPFIVQIVIVGVLFAVYGVFPSIWLILFPIFVLPIILLTLGFSFMLSLLNGVVRDIGNVLSVFMTFLMFLTPVLYAEPKAGILGKITPYNPLFYLVSAPREAILFGKFSLWRGYIFSSVLAVFVFIVCLYAFHLAETRVAERV